MIYDAELDFELINKHKYRNCITESTIVNVTTAPHENTLSYRTSIDIRGLLTV